MLLLLSLTGVVYLWGGFDSLVGWRSTGGSWRIDSTVALPPPGVPPFAVVKGEGGEVVDTLVSPAVALWPSPDTLLITYGYSFVSTTDTDSGVVLLRTHSSGAWGGWTPVRTFTGTDRGWDTLTLSTGADSLQVAFLYTTAEPSPYFAVNDVLVWGMAHLGEDWEADSILSPPYAFSHTTVTVGYTVRNNGDSTGLATVLFGAASLREESTSVSLPPDGDTTLYLSLTVGPPGYVVLYLVVSSPSDTFNANDTLLVPMRVYPTPVGEITAPVLPPPLLDGVVLRDDLLTPPWDSAGRVEASAWLDGAPMGTCTLMVARGDSSLYFALILSSDLKLDAGDMVLLAMDDNGDGSWATDSSEGWNVLHPEGWYSTPSPALRPPDYRPELGNRFAFLYDPTQPYKVQVEWRLAVGDEPDPASLPEGKDTLRMALMYRSGEDGRVLCRWPQTSDPSSPPTFGTLILEDVVGIWEKRSQRITGDRFKIYDASGRLVGHSLKGLPPGVYFLVGGGRVDKVVKR